MKKKYLFISLVFILLLSGCKGSDDGTDVSANDQTSSGEFVGVEIEQIDQIEQTTVSGETKPENTEQTASDDNRTPIKVAVMGSPALDILKKADEKLSLSGYRIDIITCEDYNEPNSLVLSGEADACLYENGVFLDSYNKKNSTELTAYEKLYFEPLAIFPGSVSDFSELKRPVKIAIPQGDVNKARVLYLLEQKGLITLKEGAFYQASMEDVTDDPYGIVLEETDLNTGWPDENAYSLIVSDYNHAIISGIDPKTSLGDENRNSGIIDMFSICLVTDKGKESNTKVKELSKALNSKEVEEYILESFYGSVVDYR